MFVISQFLWEKLVKWRNKEIILMLIYKTRTRWFQKV
jgi:hypothetical protein